MPDFDPFANFVGDQFARNNANYNNLMGYTNQASQYDPFASGGGFGNQTSYYSGLGAAYGRATGGFNAGIPGGGGGGYDPGMPIYGGGGIGSDAARAPNQPGNNPSPTPYSQPGSWDPYNPMTYAPSAQPNLGGSYGGYASDPGMPIYGGGGSSFADRWAPINTVDWNKYFNGTTQPFTGGDQPVTPSSPGSGATPQAPSQTPGPMPDMQRLLGYTPGQLYSGGGIGSDALRDTYASEIAKSGMQIYGGGGGQPQPQAQPFNPYSSSNGWGVGGFGMPGGVTGGGGLYGGKGQGSMGGGASTDIYGNPTRSGDAPIYPSGVPGMPVFQPTS